MRARYAAARGRQEQGQIIDELVQVAGYHRKYAIWLLNRSQAPPVKRAVRRRLLFQEAQPAIATIWEALDYCCAERLHPQLLPMADHLHSHGALSLTPQIREQLARISRATLARRLATLPRPTPRKVVKGPRPGSMLRTEVPLGRYDWDETRPGAIEVDLVEHNGGVARGQYAFTLTAVDVVSGWSRRRAVMGRGQAGIHRELAQMLLTWPVRPWGLHTDNGQEFLNHQLLSFSRQHGLEFTRSRPYRKNDNAHVEQKNRRFVRDIVGYDRYDTPAHVAWLNQIYALLDPYTNLFLPLMKVVRKTRAGSRVRKYFDTPRPPLQRLIDAGVLPDEQRAELDQQAQRLNPLELRRRLEALVAQGPALDQKSHNLAAD